MLTSKKVIKTSISNGPRIISKFLVVAILVSVIPATDVSAQNTVDPSFNPSMLIPDLAFSDVGTFGSAAGIQHFLELKGSVLANTSPDFLIKLKEPDTLTKVGLEDPQPNLSRLRTAAELIYDAATSKGLNPQVLLVMLHKEQSLIGNSFRGEADLQRALDRAVGFGCPDYEGCGDIFLGFYRQLFGSFDTDGSRWLGAAASLMKSFRAEVGGVRVGRGPGVDASGRVYGRPVVRTAKVGDTVTFDNTMGGYAGIQEYQTVTLGNFATAALYRYTPHVFNGNYNFWKFYTSWFKYPNGTIIQRAGDPFQYVIDNGSKRQFSTLVAQQRKLKTETVIIVSQTEFDSYPTENPLTPLDGTLIKGDASAAIYLISESRKQPISFPVFTQRKFSFAKVVTVPQLEVDSYATGSFVTPTDGTLVMGETDATVYVIDAGLKRPISFDIFKARKYSFARIMKLSDTEVTSLPTGPFMTPPDMVALKSANDATIWWFRDNTKRSVSAYVYKQRGVNTFPHLTLSDTELLSIPSGTPFPPRDGTVIKGDSTSAIYKMDKGLKRLYTASGYRKARSPKPIILPQAEVDSYQAGDNLN